MGCSPVSLRADVVHHTRTGGRGGWGGGEWQLVNAYDGVPRVPLLLGYSHVEHAVYLDPEQGYASFLSPLWGFPTHSWGLCLWLVRATCMRETMQRLHPRACVCVCVCATSARLRPPSATTDVGLQHLTELHLVLLLHHARHTVR